MQLVVGCTCIYFVSSVVFNDFLITFFFQNSGSILGPLFFILYVNDLSNVSHKIFSILFEDDTIIFMQGNNLHKLIAELQTELTKVIEWLNINKLTINLSKT